MKRKSINLSLMLLGSLVLVAFLISGCKKDQEEKAITEDPAMKAVNVNNSGTNSTPILLEDGTAIGEVIFVDDIANSMLYITFNLDAGYDADEMRLEIASKSKDIPAEKKGNLFPSDFNFEQTGTLSSYEFAIPFSYFGASGCDDGKPYYAAAYCDIDGAAAWGNGASNQGNSRGEIIGFKIECNTSGFDSDGIESAFAYGCDAATCFLSIDDDGNGLMDDFNRWGWTNEITDPGTYYFDIYAGAGQCNLTNGIIVGELIVYYDGTDVSVTYNTCGTYGLDETHLYVGTDMLPQGNNGSTIALGQFPYMHENLGGVQTDNYGPISITAPFYIIAHAVVEGDYTQGSCEAAGCDYCQPIPAGSATIVSDLTVNVIGGDNFTSQGPAVAAWVHGSWNDAIIDNGFSFANNPIWIWESTCPFDLYDGDKVVFEKTFQIPGIPSNGSIIITVDNGYLIRLNGDVVGHDLPGYPDSYPFSKPYEYDEVENGGWKTPETYILDNYLIQGLNTLEIEAYNAFQDNATCASNPAGLIFDMNVAWDAVVCP